MIKKKVRFDSFYSVLLWLKVTLRDFNQFKVAKLIKISLIQ